MTPSQLKSASLYHAEAVFPDMINDFVSEQPWPQVRQYLADSFLTGAQYALSHQWISVEERLPELRERVLICEKNGQQYKIFIGKRVPFNDGWEWNQSTKESVVAWMSLPKYNPEKQSI